MGLSIAHARNWRRIALANLGLAAFLGAGWWVQADRAVVRPFVVEVSDWGQTQRITALDGRYEPTEAQTGYLARQGMPPEVRLIKRVAATGGDAVCSDGRWMIAPMRTVRIHDRDRNGAPLPAWRGCRRLAADERLLLGDTPSSLDSRYFGPVTTAQIEGVYREALTW